MKKILIFSLFISATLTCQAVEPGSFEENANGLKWACKPKTGLPNVLILGDSISIGYTLFVRENLQGKANVYRPIKDNGKLPENCGSTLTATRNIDKWLQVQNVKKWDVIHFNWGLHDLKRISQKMGIKSNDPAVPTVNSISEYKSSLSKVLKKLKATGAKLIFATTTPYPTGVIPCRVPKDAELYNKAALEVMSEQGVEINDLYTAIKTKLKKLQMPINVHFSKAGSKFLADQVADAIKKQL
jgi:lysophospholipase L1-like esterase